LQGNGVDANGPPQVAGEAVWALLLEARRLAGEAGRAAAAVGAADSPVLRAGPEPGAVELRYRDGRWTGHAGPEPMLALYLPLCAAPAERTVTVAHLGQSLDGQIATAAGDSDYVTGPANLDHLHRMRALCDAVIVGAGTALADDPQLTTRRVAGPNPVRVVLDSSGGLAPDLQLLTDRAAPTVIVSDAAGARRYGRYGDAVETIAVPRGDAGLDLAAAVAALRARGLYSLFVEGGGRTVSAFLSAGLVDRLQIAIAPLLIGSGRPALTLPPRASLADCPRPVSRTFAMGRDVLIDCDLRSSAAAQP